MDIAEAKHRNVGVCQWKGGCIYVLIPSSSWKDLTLQQRTELLELGYNAHARRRLCHKHARAANNNRTIMNYEPVPTVFAPPADLIAQYNTTACLNECGRMMLTKWQWESLDRPARVELRSKGFALHSGRGLCRNCHDHLSKKGELDRFPHLKQPEENRSIHKRFDLPALWEAAQESGGGLEEIAAKCGVSVQRVRDVFKEIGIALPKHSASARMEERIEEIEFLHSCGSGIHEIASKLGMSDKELIEYVAGLRTRGKTSLVLQYADVHEEIYA